MMLSVVYGIRYWQNSQVMFEFESVFNSTRRCTQKDGRPTSVMAAIRQRLVVTARSNVNATLVDRRAVSYQRENTGQWTRHCCRAFAVLDSCRLILMRDLSPLDRLSWRWHQQSRYMPAAHASLLDGLPPVFDKVLHTGAFRKLFYFDSHFCRNCQSTTKYRCAARLR